MPICSASVLNETYPGIKFDSNNVSNIAKQYLHDLSRIKSSSQKNQLRLQEKLKSLRSRRSYDCIIGLSGGLDSSYMLHYAVTELGARPFVIHIDAGWNSEISVSNIRSLCDSLSIDLYTVVYDWEIVREAQLALLRSGLPYLDMVQDIIFAAGVLKAASDYKINIILNGGNIACEGVMRPAELFHWGSDFVLYNDIFRKHSSNHIKLPNLFLAKSLAFFRNVKTYRPLNSIDYSKNLAIQALSTKYNYIPYKYKHYESRFTKLFEGYILPTRFGFDVRSVDLSSLVLSGQLSRDNALAMLKEPPLTHEEVKREIDFVCHKLSISTNQFLAYIQQSIPPVASYKNLSSLLQFINHRIGPYLDIRKGGAV